MCLYQLPFILFSIHSSFNFVSKYQYRGGGGHALPLYLSLFFVNCRGFEPGAFKMVKISLKNFKHSRKFDPASFKLNVQNATIELQDSLET